MLRWAVAVLILISSFSLAYHQLRGIPTINTDGTIVPAFGDALRRELRESSSPELTNKLISEALSRGDLAEAETLIDAASFVGFPIDDQNLEQFDRLDSEPPIFRNGRKAVMGCIGLSGIELQTTAEFAGAIGCDFILIGDVRDIVLHGGAYLREAPYIRDAANMLNIGEASPDPVILTLALIGAGTSVGSFATAGAAGSADAAVSVVKNAKRANLLSPAFLQTLSRQSGEVLRLDELGKDMIAIVGGTMGDIARLDFSLKSGVEAAAVFGKRMENSALNSTMQKLATVNRNVVEVGTHIPSETMLLLKYVDDIEGAANDLDALVDISKSLGSKTRGALQIASSRQKTTAGKLAASLKKGVKAIDYFKDKLFALLALIAGFISAGIWLRLSKT